MPDVVGRYFREFGVTLVVAIVASALVSLTLTPMLCGQLLGAARQNRCHDDRAAAAGSRGLRRAASTGRCATGP